MIRHKTKNLQYIHFHSTHTHTQIKKSIFGPTCSHCSDCKGNDSHTNSTVNNRLRRTYRHSNLHQCGNRTEHGVQKSVQFKHRDRAKTPLLGDKKLTILRDPILKTIGRSSYHNCNELKPCCERMMASGSGGAVPASAHPSFLCSNNTRHIHTRRDNLNNDIDSIAYNSNNVIIDKMKNWRLHDDKPNDFRSLVTDCGKLAPNGGGASSSVNERLHKAKSFQVIQTEAGYVDDGQEASTSTAGLINRMNGANSGGSGGSSNSSSSSCSQQVRMHSTNNCDVTIDELASYFETFVHIPKKMSSMAEMMYT